MAEETHSGAECENSGGSSAVVRLTVTDTASGDTVLSETFTSPSTIQPLEVPPKFERFLSLPDPTCGKTISPTPCYRAQHLFAYLRSF